MTKREWEIVGFGVADGDDGCLWATTRRVVLGSFGTAEEAIYVYHHHLPLLEERHEERYEAGDSDVFLVEYSLQHNGEDRNWRH